AEADERSRHVVVAVDEAHLLDGGQLEAIRMMTLCRDRDYAATCMNFRSSKGFTARVSRHNPCRFP
ncbi:MAG: hypothetical protein ACRDNT_26445, partial [Streptosporangiaceae bacterium]